MRARLPVSTFALAVKDELCGLPAAGEAARAELHGLMRAAGVLPPGAPAVCEVRCARAVVARRAYRLFRAVSGVRPRLLVRRGAGAADGRFLCRVAEASAVLAAAGLTTPTGRARPRLPAPLLAPRLAPALLRGFFLGAGSVDDPARDHHLELDVDGGAPEVADGLMRAMEVCGLRGRCARRRRRLVVYLKDGEAITTLLAAMGATSALLVYEEQRIRRQVRGDVNRLVNAETANLGKSAAAGVRQAQAISRLQSSGRLAALPEPLRAVALARLQHPEASLRELGELLQPPLGKSGVQHRLRALSRLASRRSR